VACPPGLLGGGENPMGATGGFWADALIARGMLVSQYCFPEENIYMIFKDGRPHRNICGRYNVIPEYHIFPAYKDTVEWVFAQLAERMDENDLLLVLTHTHGCCYNTDDGAFLGLLGDLPENELKDKEMENLVDDITCRDKIFLMQQCFAGGFVPELDEKHSVIVTASPFRRARAVDSKLWPQEVVQPCLLDGGDAGDPVEAEPCGGVFWEHGEFFYHALNALRKSTVYYENYVESDRNRDGWITIKEVHAYECSTDSYGGCVGGERCYSGNKAESQLGPAGAAYSDSLSLFGCIYLASGELCQDTTYWSGVMTVTGDVVVPSGKILVVKAGTTVKCDSLDDQGDGIDPDNVEIIIHGALIAEGSAEDPIKFTSRADLPPGQGGEMGCDIWRGLRFRPGSSGILRHVTVRRAYYAVACDSANPVIEASSICDNHLAGILCKGNASPVIGNGASIAGAYRGIVCRGSSSPVIREGVVVDTCSIGLLIRGSSIPEIRDCQVKRCNTGISIEGSANPHLGYGCDLHSNHEAGLYISTNGGYRISIDSCDVRANFGYGILCDSDTRMVVSYADVNGNHEGVASFEYADCLLGNESTGEGGYNNIYGNTSCNVRNANIEGDTLVAENCWWGVIPPDTTKFCGGPVDYDPYLGSEVEFALPNLWDQWRNSGEGPVSLGPAVPNPTRNQVSLIYYVNPPGSRVGVTIYDTRGRAVNTLVDGWKEPGTRVVTWNCTTGERQQVGPGVYFCIVSADGTTIAARKIVVVGSGREK
jgi:hypothetical protein